MSHVAEFAMTHGSESLLRQAESRLECAQAEITSLRSAIVKLEDANQSLRECLADAMQDFDDTAPWVARARKLTE